MNKETLKLKLTELDLIASRMRKHALEYDKCQIEMKGKIYDLMKELENEEEE